jgi:hypothetical protein
MDKHLLIDNPTISEMVFYPRKTKIPENLGSDAKVLHFDITDEISIGGFYFGSKKENS